jgi:hypothetical protein
MPDALPRSFSIRLRNLTTQLRMLDRELKSNRKLHGAALREFRRALDNVRMTAWTVNELLNAREARRNPQAVISFISAERLRRFRQMVKDLCADIKHEGPTWPAASVDGLQRSASLLRERLDQLAAESHQTAPQGRQRESH